MSLRIIELLKPIPKKYQLKVNEKNIVAYFNYKKYVSVDKVCKTLLTENDEQLFDALATFSKTTINIVIFYIIICRI